MRAFVSFFRTPAAFILSIIIFLSVVIRFSSLSSLPVSLYWDEVSAGYNAYSILHTAKDEYGIVMPMLFRGYDDYKMPVYIYLSVIPIALFGLSEFSVRFVSAFFGVGSVILSYFLVRELFVKERWREYLAAIAAFIFCIVPWHVQFSRAGFEANLALFFVMLGSYSVLKSLKDNRFLYLAAFSYVISIYSYRSSLIVVPLLFSVILFLFHKRFLENSRRTSSLVSLSIFILLSLPLSFTLVKNGDARTAEVSIFTAENPKIKENILKQQQAGNTLISKIIYNRRVVYFEEAAGNYMSHFSPNFLFLKGDVNPRHSLGTFGMLYLWQLPFVLIGVFFMFRRYRVQAYFTLAWLLLAPLAASFSLPSPHALRSLLMLPPLVILTSYGIYFVYDLLRQKKFLYMTALGVVVIMSSLLYAREYSQHNSISASSEWGDGYKQLLTAITPLEDKYDKIIISGHYWQPYMYTLFYKKYDPLLFQKYGSQTGFGKYIFGGTRWDQRLHRKELGDQRLLQLAGSKKTLVALSPEEYSMQKSQVVKITDIKNHKGDIVFILGTLQ